MQSKYFLSMHGDLRIEKSSGVARDCHVIMSVTVAQLKDLGQDSIMHNANLSNILNA